MSIFDAPIPFKTRDTIFERLLINLKNPHLEGVSRKHAIGLFR